MSDADKFEIFLVAVPGTEAAVREEAVARGFSGVKITPGGVTFAGTWKHVWRANLELRCASRVIARLTSFRALHLAQLDKRARKIEWGKYLRKDMPFRVEVSCRKSRIYHSGAAAERIERAIGEAFGARPAEDAAVCIKARIEDDLCTIGIDTSGDLLHKRGHKEEVNKAPMRETLAAVFLRMCGFDGSEPVYDPMCGSGTFVIEAAEIALGLDPGRSRTFAFEQLATFDEAAWTSMRQARMPLACDLKFSGSDQDPGAIRMSRANALRAGVEGNTIFEDVRLDDIAVPAGPPGLVIVNPPYGERLGAHSGVTPLYRALGKALKTRFGGWRAGIITNDDALAKATGLGFKTTFGPVSHGGIRVWLHVTDKLAG